jgi:hypothetical protein
VIAKRVPRQFVDDAMVLVQVLAKVRENQVGTVLLQGLEMVLDFLALVRKVAATKIAHLDG